MFSKRNRAGDKEAQISLLETGSLGFGIILGATIYREVDGNSSYKTVLSGFIIENKEDIPFIFKRIGGLQEFL